MIEHKDFRTNHVVVLNSIGVSSSLKVSLIPLQTCDYKVFYSSKARTKTSHPRIPHDNPGFCGSILLSSVTPSDTTMAESQDTSAITMPDAPPATTPGTANGMRTASPTTNDPSRVRFWASVLAGRLNRMILILTYPIMVIFTVASLLLVITFCIFPTLICMTFGVCIYYCMIEDPIPLSVLLRYMLSPDPDENQYPYPYPCAQSRGAIQAKLIIRKVLETEDIDEEERQDESKETKTEEYPRRYPHPIQFKTCRKCLYFSEPIFYEDKEEKSQDGKGTESHIPLYQRLHSPEGSSGGSGRLLPADEENTLSELSTFLATPLDDDEIGLVEIAIGSADIEDPAMDQEPEVSGDVEEAQDAEGNISLGPKDNEQTAEEKNCEACSSKKPAASSESLGAKATEQIEGALEFVEDYFGITDSRERGTTCDICLLSFEKDDEVAWSPNPDCVHCYHKDCILDWLLRKPTCPSCRQNYLEGKENEDV